MLRFLRRTTAQPPTVAIRQALVHGGLPPGMDPATLAVIDRRGWYAGRGVHYFRVFDPIRAAERAIEVRRFADLDPHPDLVVASGHVEQQGAVVLTRRDTAPSVPAAARERADRATHGDDEKYVFPTSQE
jgi:hypothetical protein